MTADTSIDMTSDQLVSLFKELENVQSEEEQKTLIRKRLMTHAASEIRLQHAKYINNIGQIGTATFNLNLVNQEEDYIKKNQPIINDYFNALSVFNFSTYRALFNDLDKPLNELFVPLQLTTTILGSLEKREVDLGRLLETADKQTIQLLIQGNPGSGKSTLLSYIALNAWENPEKIGLPKAYAYMPLYVKLQHLGRSNSPDLGRKLINAMNFSEFQMDRPISDSFYTDWPHFLQARWLLLFDGYDEIEEKHRQSVDILINQLLEKNTHIIITTRPTFGLSSKLRNRFTELLIEDFDDTQKTALAHNLISNERNAHLFLSQLSSYDHRRFGSTPLMVTVAAIVFKNRQQQLPNTEIELYQEYMDNYLAEAISRNENIYFDSLKLKSTVLKVLKKIAFTMTLDPDQNSIMDENKQFTPLANNVADLVGEKIKNIDREEALELTTNYIRTLGKNVAVFQCSGNICAWLHPTFREYLTAVHIIDQGNKGVFNLNVNETWHYISKWNEDRWRKIVLFLLQKCSLYDNVDDAIKKILNEALQAGDTTYCRAVLFCATALLCDVNVNDVTRGFIYENLTGIVYDKTMDNYCNRLLTHVDDVLGERAAELIRQLSDDPLIQQHLSNLIQRLVALSKVLKQKGEQALVVQTSVFFDLAKLGQLESLLEMARDESLDDDIRIASLYTLESQAWWFNGVTEKSIKSNVAEYRIASACSNLLKSCNEEIIQLLLSILQYAYWKEKRSETIIRLIQKYSGDATLYSMLKKEEYDMERVRLILPDYLSLSINENIATDNDVDVFIRMSAVLTALTKPAYEYNESDQSIVEAKKNRLADILLDLFDNYGKIDSDVNSLTSLPETVRNKIETYFRNTDDFFLKKIICQTAAPSVIKTLAINSLSNLTAAHDLLVNGNIESKYRRILGYNLAESDWITSEQCDQNGYISLLTFLQQETTEDPHSLMMQLSLAKVLYNKNELSAADQALSHVTDMLQQMASAFRLRGIVQKSRCYYKEAITYFDSALRFNPEDDYSKYEKAACLMLLDKNEEAIVIFEQNDYIEYIYLQYRWVYVNCLIGIKDYEKAVSFCNKYLESGLDATLLALRGVAASLIIPLVDLSSAVEDLTAALDMDINYNYARYIRFLMYRRLGRINEALQDLKVYSQNTTSSPEGFQLSSLFTLLHARMLSISEATISLNQSKEYYADNPFIIYTESVILLLTNKKQEAEDGLARARELCLNEREVGEFLQSESISSISNLALIVLLMGREKEAQKCVDFLADRNERYQLVNYTLSFIEDQVVLFKNESTARFKERLEARLFPQIGGNVKEGIDNFFDPDVLYSPRQPRAPYPLPMYCQMRGISGLGDESVWAQKILDQYKRNHPGVSERIIVLFTIKDNSSYDTAVYGACNFKMDDGADYNLKFSEKMETLLRNNLKILIQKYRVEILLFTHIDFAKKIKDEIDRLGLIAKCLVVKFK